MITRIINNFLIYYILIGLTKKKEFQYCIIDFYSRQEKVVRVHLNKNSMTLALSYSHSCCFSDPEGIRTPIVRTGISNSIH